MVLGAWVFIVQSETKPMYARDSILMRGDNSSAVSWVKNAGVVRNLAPGHR